MAAFSNQHHPLILDQFSQLPNTSTFSQFYLPESLRQIPIDVSVQQSAFLEKGTKVSQSTYNNEPSGNMQSTDSSSVVDKLEIGEQVTQKVAHIAKKRKNKDGSSMSSVQSMDVAREVKGKKEKMKIKEKKPKAEKKDQKKVPQEEPTGFVHVRARRGQATDSHSLAERVRREKISERMKLLQALVPGCDKVTGKAFVLDEIINYVQSLQNQVEFLSMKLASESSMCYNFGMDLHELIIPAERLSSSSLVAPMSNVQQCNPAQATAFSETTNTTFTSPTSYPLLDSSSSSLLFDQQMEMPNILSQDNGQLLWDVDDQRQKLANQCGFLNHLCSFY